MSSAHCMDVATQRQIFSLPGNTTCCDCPCLSPQWASVSFGTLFCLECSGKHRALGVHISFVRSITMDSWTEKQIQIMKLGGNNKLNQFLKEKEGIEKNTSISTKYNSSAATLYRERIRALAEGREPPTELPPSLQQNLTRSMSSNSSTSSFSSMSNYQSNGSNFHQTSSLQGNSSNSLEVLPGETEDQYISRQARNKADADERLRQKFGSGPNRMQGFGSDPNYRPPSGAYNRNGGDITDTLLGAWDNVAGWVQEKQIGSKIKEGWDTVKERVQDPEFSSQVKEKATSFWERTTQVTGKLIQDITSDGEWKNNGNSYDNYSGNVGGFDKFRSNSQAFSTDMRSQREDNSFANNNVGATYSRNSSDFKNNTNTGVSDKSFMAHTNNSLSSSSLSSNGSSSTSISTQLPQNQAKKMQSYTSAGTSSIIASNPPPSTNTIISNANQSKKSHKEHKSEDFFAEFGV